MLLVLLRQPGQWAASVAAKLGLNSGAMDKRALIFSVAAHLSVLTLLGFMVIREAKDSPPAITMRTDTRLDSVQRLEMDSVPTSTLAGPSEAAPISSSPEVPQPLVSDPVSQRPIEISANAAKLAGVTLPKPEQLNMSFSVQGSGAEHVEGGVEGAVDRIAYEILKALERSPTLVVWAFDASGSLLSERDRLAKHIGTVYRDVLKLDDDRLSSGDNLMTMIVSFGKDRRAMLDQPTIDSEAIIKAIKAVPMDRTGYEGTFGTVAEIAQRWGRFRREGTSYQTMAIVVTDEVGDDEEKLESAIQLCKSSKTRVYVLGSAALFGQVNGLVPYTDPQTKQYYPALPIRQGPESVRLEQIHLPYWDNGPRDLFMNSGFGPYALSRLTASTGGIYFITRMSGSRMDFDPARMMEYRPEWVSEQEYLAKVQQDPLRLAINQAAMITQQQLPNRPSLTFPPTGTDAFKDAMRENQVLAARTLLTVDEAFDIVTKVAKLRDRETSKRWQAHYDLINGRLTVMKVRCLEYNWACAQMKVNPLKFKDPKSNAWRLAPDKEVHFSDRAAEAAKEAAERLRTVIDQHPNTPWAYLARRELEIPFGFKWMETYVRPPQRNNDAAAAKKMTKKMTPASKPPELPKL